MRASRENEVRELRPFSLCRGSPCCPVDATADVPEVPINRQWHWTAASFLALCAATAWLYLTRGWHRIGVPPIGPDRPPFSDAYAQLVTADACLAGAGSWIERVCFLPSIDVLPHAQSYEPWLTFSRLGLGHEQYLVVGWIMVVGFYLATCLLFRPDSWRAAGMLIVLLLSPAVQLAVERANFDLLMATILIASGWLLSRPRLATSVLACALLGLGTTLKIYSGLGTLCAWLATGNRHRRVVAAASILACLLAIAALGPANIIVLGKGAPEGTTRFSTGAHLTLDRYGPIGGSLIVAATFSLCAWLSRPIRAHAQPVEQIGGFAPQAAVFIISWLSAVPLFLLKDSYDYRLVLWLPMLALALRLAGGSPGSVNALGKVMLASFAFAAFVELACRIASSAAAPAWVEYMLVLGKHIGMWNVVFASSILLFAVLRSNRWRS